MGFLQSYSSFLLKHPEKILLGGVALVIAISCITIILRPLPTFNEPLIGFEARDTYISARLNTWKLLLEESSASANNLSLAAHSQQYEGHRRPSSPSRLNNELTDLSNKPAEPPLIEMSTQHVGHNSTPLETLDEDEEDYYRSINSTVELNNDMIHYSLGSSKAFCGKLYEGYAQVVLASSPRYSHLGLFNLNSMIAVCQLDKRLRLKHSAEDSGVFQKECERFEIETNRDKTDGESNRVTTCCNSWSLPNHIACLSNKTTCMDIDLNDLKHTEHLLKLCAPFYFRAPYEDCFSEALQQKEVLANTGASSLNMLSSASHGFNQWSRPYCGSIPDSCLRCNGWTYTVMHYLTDEQFITNRITFDESGGKLKHPTRYHNSSSVKDSTLNKLSHTSIFLPVAKSSSLMYYYRALLKYNLKTPFAQVKAMDLGLKNSLFENLVFDDSRLFIIALLSILLIISLYTWSIVLSMVILVIICLSLCLSYTIYELILNIPTFPFMNLLAVVISFGICSDNAMLFCKHWTLQEGSQVDQTETIVSDLNKNSNSEKENLDRMLRRSVVSTFAATLATACSFIISAISRVIAVRCFCIFATLSVVTNYLLIVVLLPPALIIDSRFSHLLNKFLAEKGPRIAYALNLAHYFRGHLLKIGDIIHKRWIFNLVTKYKFYLIITFIALLSCSSILVFHRPTLQPPDEEDIQLFSSRHTFEQYDKNLRKQFRFERLKSGESIISNENQDMLHELPDTLPVRVVFGLIPSDNGNHLDPQDRGSLTFDPKFDLADPNVQIWLLDFCHKLKQKRFMHQSSAPDLTNCFIDTFKSWMETRTCKDPIQTGIDRSPCCLDYEFPYSRHVFDQCIGEAVDIIRKTPQFHPNPNAGIRFFKNSTKVAVLIIEYQSNRLYTESFTKMERFFNSVDEWVSWQINNTAPASLKSGWFTSSNLELLALQTELEQSTTNSIMLEVLFAMLAMVLGSRNLVLTIAGTMTIGTIIIVTVAILILLRWTLGVAESILISLTIGLSIDFALHYSVAYNESRKKGTSSGTIHSILNDVGSPIALATITTSLAGFVIVWSDILAYQELGVFLMLIAIVSWLTSTFFLLPMLATVGCFVEDGREFIRAHLQRAIKILVDRL